MPFYSKQQIKHHWTLNNMIRASHIPEIVTVHKPHYKFLMGRLQESLTNVMH